MRIIRYIIVCATFLIASCNAQQNDKMDASRVREITISNKVYCNPHNIIAKDTIITDIETKQKIITEYSNLELIEKDINLKVGNGFFDVSFTDGSIVHVFTVNYTTYDGVVIWSQGNLYRNDKLEIAIYKLFQE